ncbi:MAG TPA: FtsQ-type POTRA domain-containing protein [Acidimicrobiia bacterium]|nr:FtsQ-type POTRA domain-containing protein [Acidimicrobiia bacterium]
MTIDPRLKERRQVVAEDRARRNIGRLLKLMIAPVLGGVAIWVVLSPWLSVDEVVTTGVTASETHGALADLGVVAGTPMMLIRPERVQQALLADPWVKSASVMRDWPDRVIVQVEERVALAWVETEAGWAHHALDGVALPSAQTPDGEMAWIRLPEASPADGKAVRDLLGALEFVAGLPEPLRAGTTIRMSGNGEFWGEVSGYEVRLGRAVEMGAKARTLTALLGEGPPPGSVLNLIAPAHPAITPPPP